MKTFFKALVLGTAVIATLATTVETSSAGDWNRRGFHGRYWHHGPGWRGRWAAAGIIGLTAGVIVGEALSHPRHDRVYVDDPNDVGPDDDYVGPVDGNVDPDDPAYAPQHDRHHVSRTAQDDQYQDDPDEAGPMDDQAQDDGYFPDRPQKQTTHRNSDVAEQGTLQPWTAKWRTYCKQRFSTFNSSTGTYAGYDGKQHFCTAG